ncbi:MAG TPA: carboxypeptidase-like regulatory domain-containing protein [Candidatus Hydrogenedentes bacterium]|nr:carboxypeptidase-like regulatory domain-containing protein [Candidatus Hydrogenedentota bacterium]
MKRNGIILGLAILYAAPVFPAQDEAASRPGAGELRVLVVNGEGAPVSGLEVQCGNPPANTYPTPLDCAPLRQITGESGQCVFSGLNQGAHSVFAEKQGLSAWGSVYLGPETSWHEQTTITLALHYRVNGIASEANGTPIPGVLLRSYDGLDLGLSSNEGAFSLPLSQAYGSTQVYATKPGFGTLDTMVHAGEGAVRFMLFPGARAELSFVDDAGNACPDLPVTLVRDSFHLLLRTDSKGRVLTPWLDAAGDLRVLTSLRQGNVITLLDKSVSLQKESEKTFVFELKKTQEDAMLTVAGKAVTESRGEPVTGVLYSGWRRENENRLDRTGPDGAFAVRFSERKAYDIYFVPDRKDLRAENPALRVDLTQNTPVHGAVITVKAASAFSGVVVDNAGSPLPQVEIAGRCSTDATDRDRVETSETGTFTLGHFNHPGGVYKLRVTLEAGEYQERHVIAPKRGKTLDGLRFVLNAPPPRPETEPGFVRGLVVDEAGAPVPNTIVDSSIPNTRGGFTNTQGEFELTVTESGPIQFSLSRFYWIQINDMISTEQIPLTLLESPTVTAKVGETVEGGLLVVKSPKIPLRFVGLQVTDENGLPLDADIGWYSGDTMGSLGERNGRFVRTFSPERQLELIGDRPVFFEITKPEYQARIIQSGRDFDWNTVSTCVRLVKGPFPEGVSVFEAVTGYPGAAQMPLADRFKDKIDEYARLAASSPPKPYPSKDIYRFDVVDAAGNPLDAVRVMPIGHDISSPHDMLWYVQFAPYEQAKTLYRIDGFFRLNVPGAVVWAKDAARVFVKMIEEGADAAPAQVVLTPGAKVQLEVRHPRAKESTPVSAWPAFYGPMSGLSGYPDRLVSDNGTGRITFDNLPPGRFDVLLGLQNGLCGFAGIELEPGHVYKTAVTLPDNRAARVSQRLRDFRNMGFDSDKARETAATISQEERKIIANYIKECAANYPGRYSWELEALEQWAGVARLLALRDTADSIADYLGKITGDSMHGAIRQTVPAVGTVAALEGNKALPKFKQLAAAPNVIPAVRQAATAALMLLNTEEGRKAFLALRDAARTSPGAPLARDTYTHGERMTETLRMTFQTIPGIRDGDNDAGGISGSPWVDEDFATGRHQFLIGNDSLNIEMRRFGPEWLITRIDIPPQVVP